MVAKAAAFEARDYTHSIVAIADFNAPEDPAAVMMATMQAKEAASTTASSSVDGTVTDEPVETETTSEPAP
jgi:endonuclease/exonuclease/phosphatase family metal-dependent hydrolase